MSNAVRCHAEVFRGISDASRRRVPSEYLGMTYSWRSMSVVGAGEMDGMTLAWPPKYDVFGVGISATSYDEAQAVVMRAAKARSSATVTHISAHGLTMAARDGKFREIINSFDIAAPDGQPVRWSLKWFHRQK